MRSLIGLIVMNLFQPGKGLNIDPASLDAKSVADYAKKAGEQNTTDFVMHIIPKTFTDAFTANGDLLQVLLIAILFGFALSRLGDKGKPVFGFIESASKVLFGMVNIVMKAWRRSARSALLAFTIGKYGIGTIANMAKLVGTFYFTSALFVVLVLGTVAAFTRVFDFSLPGNYIKAETADRARHEFLGKRARAADGKTREARLLQVGGRPRRAFGLFVQSRRHQYLYDDGFAVHRAGTEYRSHARPGRTAPCLRWRC